MIYFLQSSVLKTFVDWEPLWESEEICVSPSARCPCKQVLPVISEKSLSFLLLVNLSTAYCMLSLFPDVRELPSTALCLHFLSESTPPSHPFSIYCWFAVEKFQPLSDCCVLLQQMNTTSSKSHPRRRVPALCPFSPFPCNWVFFKRVVYTHFCCSHFPVTPPPTALGLLLPLTLPWTSERS